MLALLAIVSVSATSCGSKYAVWRAKPVAQRVAIGEVTCSDKDVAAVVHNCIAQELLTRPDFISLAGPADKPDFTVSATVTFGHGSSAGNNNFTLENKSAGGEFVNDVSIVATGADGRILAISTRGQKISGGGQLNPPSAVARTAMNGIVDSLEEYARTGHCP